MPPQKQNNKWRFCIRDSDNRKRWLSFTSYDECHQEWERYINRRKKEAVDAVEIPIIEREDNTDDLWDNAYRYTSERRKDTPQIFVPHRPFAIAFLSDLHIGSQGTDYHSLRRDAETVRDTDGMYAVFHGDGIDNWIIPKMQGLQRGQAMPFDDELALFRAWITTISSKLLVVVAGNHDNWTTKLAGFDWLKSITPTTTLYDPQQITFDVHHGNNKVRICVRHKWRGNSILNPTHALERAARDIDADIYVGGHTHIGTLFRSFTVRDKERIAVLTGTYKIHDAFGREIGVPDSMHRGCGAVVFDPDGSMVWIRNLQEASRYLKFKQQEYDNGR